MFTIERIGTDGKWHAVLGALVIDGQRQPWHEFGSLEQAARAALLEHANASPAQLRIINDETKEAHPMADIMAAQTISRCDLTRPRAPGYRGAGVTRAEYDNARKLISDNGR